MATDIVSGFEKSRYTLILASNYLPGFLLFELVEFTAGIRIPLEFKVLFAFLAGSLITEWFYEWISILMNIYTLTIGDRERYKKFLKIMSPIRILRCLSKVDEKEKSEVEIASYPQSMALMCSYGSIGWLLIFSSILNLKGLFFILIGITILIALKTICRAFSKEEAKNIEAYSAFLRLLICYILFICIVFFNPIGLPDAPVSFSAIHIFLIGLCFLLIGSAYYLNSVQKAIDYFIPNE